MAAAVVAASVAHLRVSVRGSRNAEPYRVGDEFDLPVNVRLDESDRTAILILHSGCRFCEESMPFYRTLVDRPPGLRTFRVVVLALEPIEAAAAFLARHGVRVDTVVPYLGAGRIRFAGTPTVMIVDRSRRVMGVWTGKLTASQERRVRRLLTNEDGS